MPEYVYRAVDSNGVLVRNKVQEKSKQSLVKKLKLNGLMPIDVTQVSFGKYGKTTTKKNVTDIDELMQLANSADISKNKNARQLSTVEKINMQLSKTEKVTHRDLVIFTQNLYLLKKAGFNNVHALGTIIQSTENFTLKGVLEDILAGVEAGDYMYTTMEYYSDIFPYIYINLVKVGELSGSLDESLRQAVEYLDSADELNKKLKKILVPNIMQFVVLIVLLFFGSMYVVPIIQDVFDQVGTKATLPWYTIMFSNFLNKAQQYWLIPTLIVAALLGLFFLWKSTPRGRYRWDYFKYRMPVFGELIFAIDFSRLSKAMMLNLKNGMRIQEALEVGKNVVKNLVMLSIIETAINNIIIGDSWVEPFEKSGLAKPMITEMLKIGMQTDLSEMMEKLVEYMEIDIDQIMEKIVKILPQILYAVIGVLIIFITLVVLVPCIEVYMGNFLFEAVDV